MTSKSYSTFYKTIKGPARLKGSFLFAFIPFSRHITLTKATLFDTFVVFD
jgi:hypothetical protein